MRVLAIGDLHLPATRKGYREFCRDTAEKYDCDKIVFIGDIIDWHAISFWTKQPECPGSKDEYELALNEVKKWYKTFPDAVVCLGNHDRRPARLAQTVNIPEFMLVPYSQLWKTPKWKWDFKFYIDKIQYRHGEGLSGIHPAWNAMNNKLHCGLVIGHCHSRAGIKWTCSSEMRMFGMDVGCGIDERTFQFAYGKAIIERPFLSCGVILDGIPFLIPMACGRGEKYWDGNFGGK